MFLWGSIIVCYGFSAFPCGERCKNVFVIGSYMQGQPMDQPMTATRARAHPAKCANAPPPESHNPSLSKYHMQSTLAKYPPPESHHHSPQEPQRPPSGITQLGPPKNQTSTPCQSSENKSLSISSCKQRQDVKAETWFSVPGAIAALCETQC